MKKIFFWHGFQICLVILCITHVTPVLACDCANTNTAPAEVGTETSNDSTTDTPVEIATPIDYAALEISELYPDPAEGEEEFIEIHNTGEAALDLSQLVLRDAAGHSYAPSTGTTINGGEYLALSQSVTGVSLNNTGDTVELLDAGNTVVCTVMYDESEGALSWGSVAGEWSWSTPTPNAINVALASEEVNTENANEYSDSEAHTVSTEPTVETEETTQTAQAADTATPTTSNTVILSELLPNPETSDTTDEWIEIQNSGSEPVLLRGWQLTDTVTTFSIPETTLAPEEYVVFGIEDTHIALNNSGDTVYLIDGFGTILHGTTFDIAPAGESWSFLGGVWSWSALTPNDDNAVITQTEETTENASESSAATKSGANETSSAAESKETMTIDSFRIQDLGATGIITGIVTVEPGIFGDQYFYIQDDHAGIQVYAYNKQFPDLSIGDRIQVSGTLSSTRNEARIKISSAQDITILSHGQAPQAIESEELGESVEGMLVSVEGSVASSTSTHIILASGIDVTIKSGTDINSNSLEDESNITVIGIVSQYDDAYRILPRASEDITVDESVTDASGIIPAAHAAQSSTYSVHSAEQSSAGASQFPWSIFLLGGSIAVCIGLGWRHLVVFAKRLISPHSASQHIQSPLPPVQHISWTEAQSISATNTQNADHLKDSTLF